MLIVMTLLFRGKKYMLGCAATACKLQVMAHTLCGCRNRLYSLPMP